MITATVYCLLYGDEYNLHHRLLSNLLPQVHRLGWRITVWGNVLGDRSRQYVDNLPNVKVIHDPTNTYKPLVMHKLLHQMGRIREDWVVWFDDDSRVARRDWAEKTVEFVESHGPELVHFGQMRTAAYLSNHVDLLTKQPWFRGLPPLQNDHGHLHFRVVWGSYWWMRSSLAQQLDWMTGCPHDRASDDLLMGEAVRQQGHMLHEFNYGVQVGSWKRRVGWKVEPTT